MLFPFTGTWKSKNYPQFTGVVESSFPYYEKEFETVVIFKPCEADVHNDYFKKDRHFKVNGKYDVDHDGLETFSLGSLETEPRPHVKIVVSKKISETKWKGTYKYFGCKDYGILNFVCVTTCEGCLREQPNQLAHMDPGGCLCWE